MQALTRTSLRRERKSRRAARPAEPTLRGPPPCRAPWWSRAPSRRPRSPGPDGVALLHEGGCGLGDVAGLAGEDLVAVLEVQGGLQRRRVERSMFLLRETDRSITDICFDVGFSSLGTFSRTFRQIVGESPTDYRKRRTAPVAPVPSCLPGPSATS